MALTEAKWGSIPVGLVSVILSKWLQLKDLVILDTACMSSDTRVILQSFLANVTIEEPIRINSDVQCRWILRTQIQMTRLHFELATMDLELASRVLKQSCRRLNQLHL
jgi:hypothetical protein